MSWPTTRRGCGPYKKVPGEEGKWSLRLYDKEHCVGKPEIINDQTHRHPNKCYKIKGNAGSVHAFIPKGIFRVTLFSDGNCKDEISAVTRNEKSNKDYVELEEHTTPKSFWYYYKGAPRYDGTWPRRAMCTSHRLGDDYDEATAKRTKSVCKRVWNKCQAREDGKYCPSWKKFRGKPSPVKSANGKKTKTRIRACLLANQRMQKDFNKFCGDKYFCQRRVLGETGRLTRCGDRTHKDPSFVTGRDRVSLVKKYRKQKKVDMKKKGKSGKKGGSGSRRSSGRSSGRH